MGKVRVVVLDDQMIARGYFEQTIAASNRYEVVGSFGSAEAAVRFCAARAVDVAVLDVVMRHGMDGLEAAAAIKEARPACKVVIVTSMPEADYLARARAAGVEGFWYKEYADVPLLDVLDAVCDGRTVYPDAAPPVALGNARAAELTDAELAVLREMVTGTNNAEIAARLGVSVHPDAARQSFSCPYCGHTMPYSDRALAGMRPLAYKHREVPVEDGLLKLIRVAVLTGVAEDLRDGTDPGEAHVRWARSFVDYIAAIDRRAYVARRDRFEFTFICPHCAAPVPGSSTQTMYACESCGSVFGLDDLAAMGLDKMPQVIGNQSMVPSKCLPFKLGRVQAEGRIRYLASRNLGFFDGFDLGDGRRVDVSSEGNVTARSM